MPPPSLRLRNLSCIQGISLNKRAVIGPVLKARLIEVCGRTPLLGPILRTHARDFAEGSVTTIRSGVAAGLRWRRYHRFLNGYWLGNYELDVQLGLQRLLQPGGVFYDVGANAGFFTVLAARLVGPQGKVFAFEPVPESADALREQIALNGFFWCEVVPCAVGSHRATRTLSYSPGRPEMGRLDNKWTSSELEINVETLTFDDFVSDHPFPAVVKVDVEGAETEVLQGSVAAIRRVACLVLELHGADRATEVVRILSDAGYGFESLGGSPVPRPIARTRLVARPKPS